MTGESQSLLASGFFEILHHRPTARVPVGEPIADSSFASFAPDLDKRDPPHPQSITLSSSSVEFTGMHGYTLERDGESVLEVFYRGRYPCTHLL